MSFLESKGSSRITTKLAVEFLKEEILAKTLPVNCKPGRYRPDDQLLSFLKNL